MDVLILTVVHHPLDARITSRQARALADADHRVRLAAPWSAYAATAPAHVDAIDLPRARGRHRAHAARAAHALLINQGRDADVVVVHDPELAPAVMATCPDHAVWDVHEDTAASLADKRWLPAAVRPPVRSGVAALERRAEARLRLILAEEAYAARFARPHPVIPNRPWVPDRCAPPDDRRVVAVGRLSRGRGVDQLLALPAHLPRGVTVELIGQADDDVAERLAAAHEAGTVAWHGFLPNDDALARVDGAAAGLSLLGDTPNYRQSLPTKVTEYMARGVPVITTPNPQAAAIVRETGAGLVVPDHDLAATARAVAWLLHDDDARRLLGSRGHAAAQARFDWRPHAQRFTELLADIPAGGDRWPSQPARR
jgi:glycosyltransferase involved in cell wall biosynthesis